MGYSQWGKKRVKYDLEDLAKQRKKKVHRYGKKEIKLSLFTDNMIDHLYGKSEKKNLPRTEKWLRFYDKRL